MGAVVVLNATGVIVGVHDMPVQSSKLKSGKLLQRIDVIDLSRTLGQYDLKQIVLENVSAMPGQGSVSTFNFGHSFGTIEAVARLTGAEVAMVRPAAWKKTMKVSADKDSTRARATALAGNGGHWPLKKHDGRAEAFLLALMGLSGEGGAEDE